MAAQQESQKYWLRRIVYMVLATGALFFIITAPYWAKQAEYVLHEDQTTAVIKETASPDTLQIARLKIEAPVVYAESADEKTFQGALQRGVVHYPGTAEIGKPGNAYIFGHSSDYIWKRGKYKTVFALLPWIRLGDEITVTDREGDVFTYRVIETEIVRRDDLSVLGQRDYKQKLITLQTSYPVGTALKRFVAVAELVEK